MAACGPDCVDCKCAVDPKTGKVCYWCGSTFCSSCYLHHEEHDAPAEKIVNHAEE